MLYLAAFSKLSMSRCTAGDAQSRYPKAPPSTCPSRSTSTVVGVACTASMDATFALASSKCGKVRRVFRNIGFDQARRFFDVEPQHHQPLVLVALMQRFESGPLSQTMGSPGGPKVHEYHLPFERPQGDVLPVQIR